MGKKITLMLNGVEVKSKSGISISKLLETNSAEKLEKPIGAIVNHRLMGLYTILRSDCIIDTVGFSSKEGASIYRRTLSLIMCEAFAQLYPKIKLEIGQSLGNGYYYRDRLGDNISKKMLNEIDAKMREIVASDRPLRPKLVSTEAAIEHFKEHGFYEKVALIKQRQVPEINWVVMGEFHDLSYGPVASNTGFCDTFSLFKKAKGFVLSFPDAKGKVTEKLKPQLKLFSTYQETRAWNKRVSVWSISQLNQACIDGSISEIIKVSEGLQEKKIARMADEIYENKDTVRLVAIAGPSSSGKTTFTKRLGIQLRVNGIRPVMLSMDNYYVDRVKTPLNPDGSYDFECLEALDFPLFNKHLEMILDGKRVDTPIFDFVKGERRSDKTIPMKLEKDQVLMIEGIHGLNPKMTASIPNDKKFKIYVSALTQLTIDEHNRIFTSDMRLMRRIVRDRLFRGYLATQTIKQWPSVRAGENKHIFPFQEEADVMFDTALVYEPAVLKPYLRRYLMEVRQDEKAYTEAYRLFQFLGLFIPVFPHEVPGNSLLREFIGESAFNY